MPIVPSIKTIPLSQDAFGKLAFEVMRHVFEIHDEYGRFFDEIIYKRELTRRMAGLELEVAVDVIHKTFQKTYYADVIANGGGLFEFKAAEAIHPRHRAQITHYLLLFGFHHGKIINMRPEAVEHEFVNVRSNLLELRNPRYRDNSGLTRSDNARDLRSICVGLIQDWGTGLDLSLYEEAITHFLGGEAEVLFPISVAGTDGELGTQKMRLARPDAAFKLTGFSPNSPALARFQVHAQRLLNHTSLESIEWINMHQTEVTFTTIQRA
ncbi:MAG: GxxExxY protein [Pirellulaceae bacterium]|nr:GxxExxY protein [Pirellulaceae bacterium]